MDIDNKFMKQTYIFIASSLGYLIGGGFMSGQESMQYFVPFGYKGILVSLTFVILIVITNLGFVYAGTHGKVSKGTDVYTYFCGPVFGKAFEWFAIIFCLTMYIAEIAAGGAILYEQYNLPILIGASATAILTAFTVTVGLNSVLKSLGAITPFLVIFIIVIGGITIMKYGGNLSDYIHRINSGEFTLLKVAPNWFLSGFSLVGLMVLFLSSFTTDLATKYSKKPLIVGQTIGLILFAALELMQAFAISSDIENIEGKQIGTLILASRIWEPLGMVFGILIFLAIYTICTPLVHVIASKFTKEGTTKNKILVWSIALIALVSALLFPFDEIINFVYKISAIMGSAIVLFVFIKFVRIIIGNNKEYKADKRSDTVK
ncbi:hypothetical protein [Mammaliicoccus sciuri]|uniref:YkvI family membrane protein n=1 Tax=Mammaliicoccus sciuri TaxID=1296 RepID=UPI001FB37451|nr:hypothetical protein [Mammaliicoccus sciuri]MCJ0952499.1 hypothetical protein [Mammaliicoccus sciuri]